MENKKQSSVEWLNRWFIDNPEATYEEGKSALKKAKAMHKEEMKELYLSHVTKAERLKKIFEKQFEELYNETFGGDNE